MTRSCVTHHKVRCEVLGREGLVLGEEEDKDGMAKGDTSNW